MSEPTGGTSSGNGNDGTDGTNGNDGTTNEPRVDAGTDKQHHGIACEGEQRIPTPRQRARYGWRRQLPDHRDFGLSLTVRTPGKLPKTHSFGKSPHMPAVFDQGPLGSCTGNAGAGIHEYIIKKEKQADYVASRLALYWGARYIEQTVRSDAGAEIRDILKVMASTGVGPESLWPYNIARFADTPPQAYFTAAAQHRCLVFEAVPQDEKSIKSVIAADFPIIYGISVYESFESDKVARTGIVPVPKSSEQLLGGHAIWSFGYTTTRLDDRNSWGPEWGQHGNFSIPLDYVLNPDLAGDFWTVRVIQ